MTDATPTPDFNALFARATAEYHARCERRAACRPANKTALFDALAKAGITTVTVAFDGMGDSGQIESIQAHSHDDPVALPEGEIPFAEPAADSATTGCRMMTIEQSIETLVYHALEEAHAGWENNDGAYGDFTFNVETRTIELDFNERHMDSDYSHHEF